MKKHIDLDNFVDTHDRPFVVIGEDFSVVSVNKAYEKAFQISRDELQGKKCHEILHHHDRPCFEMGEECPYEQCYVTEKTCSCLHTHFDQKGRTRWVRINFYPLRAADGTLYVGEMLQEIAAREEELEDDLRPVGSSAAFLRMVDQLEQAAHSDAPAMLIGETGTGKELAANFIHQCSQRRKKPFIALDCTMVTESLFESEVFGHERGSFTGSVGLKEGLFEVADGGTLFLDEIGEATLAMQAKLLRVLESGEFRRVGGNTTLRANVRIVCATNRQLWEQVKTGKFREDLYYRIACFCIRIPSLRERLEDVPILCESLLQRITHKEGRRYHLTKDAIEYLTSYNYPGNIRELRNILQVAVAHSSYSPGGAINSEKVRHYLRMRGELEKQTRLVEKPANKNQSSYQKQVPPASADYSRVEITEMPRQVNYETATNLKDVEAQHISELLAQYGGNRRKVAEALAISERTLYRKLKRHQLTDKR
ncbi:MAG: sigma 54-interacting transcriptional regulator [Gammaproteobacteria bacterium]|nr:sigma 54-interacting transcriptional regulator [Gammaproteobacteria bacterium]